MRDLKRELTNCGKRTRISKNRDKRINECNFPFDHFKLSKKDLSECFKVVSKQKNRIVLDCLFLHYDVLRFDLETTDDRKNNKMTIKNKQNNFERLIDIDDPVLQLPFKTFFKNSMKVFLDIENREFPRKDNKSKLKFGKKVFDSKIGSDVKIEASQHIKGTIFSFSFENKEGKQTTCFFDLKTRCFSLDNKTFHQTDVNRSLIISKQIRFLLRFKNLDTFIDKSERRFKNSETLIEKNSKALEIVSKTIKKMENIGNIESKRNFVDTLEKHCCKIQAKRINMFVFKEIIMIEVYSENKAFKYQIPYQNGNIQAEDLFHSNNEYSDCFLV